MTVAFDAATESHTAGSGSANQASFTWNHTAAAGANGLLVFVFTNADASDITSVVMTTNNITLDVVSGGRAVDSAGEAGRCDAYFYAGPVPSGSQAIVVNRTNNSDVMYAVSISVTAAQVPQIVSGDIVLTQGDGTLAEVSVAHGSISGMGFAGVNSGLPTPPAQGASSTQLHTIDYTARSTPVCRETTAGTGSRSFGFSDAGSDDRAAVHLVISESGNKGIIFNPVPFQPHLVR